MNMILNDRQVITILAVLFVLFGLTAFTLLFEQNNKINELQSELDELKKETKYVKWQLDNEIADGVEIKEYSKMVIDWSYEFGDSECLHWNDVTNGNGNVRYMICQEWESPK